MIKFNIGKYDCLKSTNIYLSDIIKLGNAGEGMVVVAEEQSTGKGYGENSWESEKGKNLLFSIYLKPDFLAANKQFFLSIAISISIISVLRLRIDAKELKIKWPNDIYFGRKKIGGILIENSVMGEYISDSIIGVGLNVNQINFHEKLPHAISLINILKEITDRDNLLVEILDELKTHLNLIAKSEFNLLKANYYKELFLKGLSSEFMIDGHIVDGKIKGINDYGQLQIEVKGQIKEFGFKEVEYII